MRLLLLCILLFLSAQLFSQLPETDIFLCGIKKDSTGFSFTRPENITMRPGYENQPYFTPEGNKILYVIADSQQTDIYSYDIEAKINKQVTETAESEYSPCYTPNRKFMSVVRVDADSGQRYYNLEQGNVKASRFVVNTDSIGYACWLNDSSLAMFILGPSHTLQVLDTKKSTRRLVASDIGRCMKLSSDGSKMYFVLKSNPEEWFIYSMSCKDYSLKRVTQTMQGSEDFAILPGDEIIMGKEGKLYLSERSSWKMIADFSGVLGNFYRITVSPDGTRLALVAFTGKKP